ncbi:MAG: PIF1 family ATP-dependent DNA helicase [Thermoanaerobaculia bacterium]
MRDVKAPRVKIDPKSLAPKSALDFDGLVTWVENVVPKLRQCGVPRPRRNHIQRMFEILDHAGSEEVLAYDWIALAKKIAQQLGFDAPKLSGPRKFAIREPRIRTPGAAPPWGRGSLPPSGSSAPRKRRREKRLATRPRREPIEMNPQLEKAFKAVANGKPIIFVTGGAGTGKSTFIRELRERFSEKQSVVLAPTGVAALNAGGQTIHSFCKLPLRVVTPEDIREVDDRTVIEKLELLIIDEISMVRADILDGLEAFLRVNRRSKVPFGGVQVVLVGDLFQLPPVVTRSDRPFLEERYDSPFFFSARSLKGLSFAPVELRTVYRQRDPEFATMLRAIREADTPHDAIDRINRQCVGRELSGRYLTLVPTRNAAAARNERSLAALSGSAKEYKAQVEGTFATGSDDRTPAPQTLALKPGAQVMFVRNHPEKLWVNGTVGTVEKMSRESIRVRLDDGASVEVEPVIWENIRYSWDEKEQRIVDEVVGTFTQFPLMPAWAVTIHKAQGLTLDRVAIDLGGGAFADGQIYVALSRCRSLEGLSLARAVRPHEIRASEASRDFYSRIRTRSRPVSQST